MVRDGPNSGDGYTLTHQGLERCAGLFAGDEVIGGDRIGNYPKSDLCALRGTHDPLGCAHVDRDIYIAGQQCLHMRGVSAKLDHLNIQPVLFEETLFNGDVRGDRVYRWRAQRRAHLDLDHLRLTRVRRCQENHTETDENSYTTRHANAHGCTSSKIELA